MKLDIHYLFTAKYARWIILSLISVFSVLIIGEFVSLFFSPLNSSEENKPAQTLIKKDAMHDILHSSLFGVYVPVDLNEGGVKKSMLQVTIVGILYLGRKEESQVIIRSAGGEEKSYKVGDSIPGGVKIQRITKNGVLVERNGELESLSFPKNDLIFEPASKPLKEE